MLEKKLEKVDFSSAIRGYWVKSSLMTMFIEIYFISISFMNSRAAENFMQASVTLAPSPISHQEYDDTDKVGAVTHRRL